jgi:hypothetical protein
MTMKIPRQSDVATDAERPCRNASEPARSNSAPVPLHGLPRSFLFELGHVVATPGAIQLLEQTNTDAVTLLDRHRCGDWGAISAHDMGANKHALPIGARLMPVYTLGEKN